MLLLMETGEVGEVYNVGTTEEYTNLTIARMLCELFDKNPADHIALVADRPFNGRRSSLNLAQDAGTRLKPEPVPGAGAGRVGQLDRDNADRFEHLAFGPTR